MKKDFINIGSKDAIRFAAKKDIIANAIMQKKQGIIPHYVYMGTKKDIPKNVKGGFLIANNNGWITIAKKNDAGRWNIIQGWAGEFIYL